MTRYLEENRKQRLFDNVELQIWNFELVGFADYIIMNYSIKIIIQYSHYSLRSETVGLLSYENAA